MMSSVVCLRVWRPATDKSVVTLVLLIMLMSLLLTRPLEASAADTVCPRTAYEHRPQGWTEPLTLLWNDDGALDVVSCARDPDTKITRLLRWATVYLPGIRTAGQQGMRRLILDTRDGAMDLGDVSAQPCLGKSERKSRLLCSLLFGEKKRRHSDPIIWSLSLSLGEDGAIATETLFSPHLQPQPWTSTEVGT